MNGVVLGGTSSGVGKTVASLAVLRALESAGYDAQPAKAGPDFIDPSHHEGITDKPSPSLDPWLEGVDGTRRTYYRGEGDVCVVEGMMGLYDGSVASTAGVAETLDLPVVLVVDASASMQSVGATALGFQQYAESAGCDVDVVGVLAQQAHGGRHAEGVRDALPDSLDYFGRIPPSGDLEIPDRHLGLHMGEEAPLDEDALDAAAEHVHAEQFVDVARAPPRPEPRDSTSETRARVAVAADEAFCFEYPSVRERLRTRADVVTFSPVAGDDLPACDGVYLPGGYPELHAESLAASPALDTLADRAADGLPVLGECGGLMALTRSLTTTEGTSFEMAGILPADVTMRDRYQALDHVELVAREDTLTAGVGKSLRGHEFHYSSTDVDGDATFAYDVERGDGITDERDGLTEYETLGTYAHVHAESGAFDTFLDTLDND